MSAFGSMNKQEKVAWMGLAVLVPTVLYLAWMLFLDPIGRDGQAAVATRRIATYASYVFVAGYLWIRRRSAGLLVDERDRQINGRAVRAGFIGLAIMLALAVAAISMELAPIQEFVESRTASWILVYLMLGIYISMVVVCIVRLAHYWRDRQ